MNYTPASQWRTLNWGTPPWIGRTSECWIHHGASGQPTLATLRAYERFHVSTQGWLALGYSWAVTREGIYEGRGWHRAGAHTFGRNRVSHAVLLVGDWRFGTVPQPMVDMAAEVIRDGIAVGALTEDVEIGGHKEAPDQSTLCPGAGGMVAVPKIRAAVHRPRPEPEQEDIVASIDELRDVVRDELYARVRPRQNEAVRLAQAACEGTVALHRQQLGLPPSPEDDRRWSDRIRAEDDDTTMPDAVAALREKAKG